jgi:hypothetical protein
MCQPPDCLILILSTTKLSILSISDNLIFFVKTIHPRRAPSNIPFSRQGVVGRARGDKPFVLNNLSANKCKLWDSDSSTPPMELR